MHPLDLDLPTHLQNLHVPHVSVVPGESLWPALARLREKLKFLQSYLTGVFLVIFDLWCGWLPPRLFLSWQVPSDSRGAAVSPRRGSERPLPVADQLCAGCLLQPVKSWLCIPEWAPRLPQRCLLLRQPETRWFLFPCLSTPWRDVIRPLLLWQLFMKKHWKVKALVA